MTEPYAWLLPDGSIGVPAGTNIIRGGQCPGHARPLVPELGGNDYHVVPRNDLIGHLDDACPCIPTVDPVERDDGSYGWVHVHHSLNGREARE